MPIIITVPNLNATSDSKSYGRYKDVPVRGNCRKLCNDSPDWGCPECLNDWPYLRPVTDTDKIYYQFKFLDNFNPDPTNPQWGWWDDNGPAWLYLEIYLSDGTILTPKISEICSEWMVGYYNGQSYQNVVIDMNLVKELPITDCFAFRVKSCPIEIPEYTTVQCTTRPFSGGDCDGSYIVAEFFHNQFTVYECVDGTWQDMTPGEGWFKCQDGSFFYWTGLEVQWINPININVIPVVDNCLSSDNTMTYETVPTPFNTPGLPEFIPVGYTIFWCNPDWEPHVGGIYIWNGTEFVLHELFEPGEVYICMQEHNGNFPQYWSYADTGNSEACSTAIEPVEPPVTSEDCIYCYVEPLRRMLSCEGTVEVSSTFTGFDCDGKYYGKMSAYLGTSSVLYSNVRRVKASFEVIAYPILTVKTDDQEKVLSTQKRKRCQFRTWPITEDEANTIATIFTGKDITLDAEVFDAPNGDVPKNNDDSKMWLIDINLERFLCEVGKDCD